MKALALINAEGVSISLTHEYAEDAAKPDGISVKKVWKHKLIDIHALYAARPDLVTLEPKTNNINAAIRQDGVRQIPGLEIWEETETSVRW